MRCWTVLPIVVVAFFLPSVARSDPPSGIEAEQYERATKFSYQGRLGEAVKILRGLQSPIAKARLALLIAKDNVDARLLGITSFDPNLAARLAKESIPVLRRDAETHAESALILGVLYEDGLGVKSDLEAAFRLYKSAANRGHARAMGRVSQCYFEGLGVTKDSRRAVVWLQRSAELGDTLSMVILGERYEYGDDGPKNPSPGFQLYQKAANAGAILGMRACARVSQDRFGRAVEKKDPRAALTYLAVTNDWLEKAAEAGDALSMWKRAGWMRIAIPSPDLERAFHLYREAAGSGVGLTMLELGACYVGGTGTDADPEKADDLFKRAEVAAKREGNDKLEVIAHRLLAEKTKEGRISLIRQELGWSADDFASFIGHGDTKAVLGGPSQSSGPERKTTHPDQPPIVSPVRPNVQLMVTDKAAVPESAAAAEPPVDPAKDDRALQEAKKSDEERIRQNALDKEFLPAVGAGLHILHDDKLGTTCITLALKLTTTYLFFAYVSEGQQPASATAPVLVDLSGPDLPQKITAVQFAGTPLPLYIPMSSRAPSARHVLFMMESGQLYNLVSHTQGIAIKAHTEDGAKQLDELAPAAQALIEQFLRLADPSEITVKYDKFDDVTRICVELGSFTDDRGTFIATLGTIHQRQSQTGGIRQRNRLGDPTIRPRLGIHGRTSNPYRLRR